MAKPNRPSAERLIEAPIIYADKVPTVSLNSGIVDLTLAATLTEVLEDDTRQQTADCGGCHQNASGNSDLAS